MREQSTRAAVGWLVELAAGTQQAHRCLKAAHARRGRRRRHVRKQSVRAAAARVAERTICTQQVHRHLTGAEASVACQLCARQSRKRKHVRERSAQASATRVIERVLARRRRIAASKLLAHAAPKGAATCESRARELPPLESSGVPSACSRHAAGASPSQGRRKRKHVRERSTQASATRVVERVLTRRMRIAAS